MEVIAIEIKREYYEREEYYNFLIKEGKQTFSIIFGGNLDLYWNLIEANNKNLSIEELNKETYGESSYTFTITKENYFIYNLFNELYNDIKDSRIFIPTDKLNGIEQSDQELNQMNESYKKFAAYKMLFDGETISWHSDDDRYDRADRVVIKKEAETFILEFIRPKTDCLDYAYRANGKISIRFSNSGSTYDPYNIIFMRMFNKLQEYDPDYHQMHIEEISYNKKLTLKNNI